MKYLKYLNESKNVPIDVEHDIDEFYKMVDETNAFSGAPDAFIEHINTQTEKLIEDNPTMSESSDAKYYAVYKKDYTDHVELLLVVKAVSEMHAALISGIAFKDIYLFISILDEFEYTYLEELNETKMKGFSTDLKKKLEHDKKIIDLQLNYLK